MLQAHDRGATAARCGYRPGRTAVVLLALVLLAPNCSNGQNDAAVADGGPSEADEPGAATANGLSPEPLPTVGPFSAVATGRWHTCAIRSDGAIECWGRNDAGQADPPEGTIRRPRSRWAPQLRHPHRRRHRVLGIRARGSTRCAGRALRLPGCRERPQLRRARRRRHQLLGRRKRRVADSAGRAFRGGRDQRAPCLRASWQWRGSSAGAPTTPGKPTRPTDASSPSLLAPNSPAACASTARSSAGVGGTSLPQGSLPRGTSAPSPSASGTTAGLRADHTIQCWGPWPFPDNFGHASSPSGQFSAVDSGTEHSCGFAHRRHHRMLGPALGRRVACAGRRVRRRLCRLQPLMRIAPPAPASNAGAPTATGRSTRPKDHSPPCRRAATRPAGCAPAALSNAGEATTTCSRWRASGGSTASRTVST